MPPKKPADDKRYIPRWEVNNRIRYRIGNGYDFQEGATKDLSSTGACLLTSGEIRKNQPLHLQIYLANKLCIEVKGHALWIKPGPEGYMAGIAFDDPSGEAQDKILQYAFEVKREDVVQHWFSGWTDKP